MLNIKIDGSNCSYFQMKQKKSIEVSKKCFENGSIHSQNIDRSQQFATDQLFRKSASRFLLKKNAFPFHDQLIDQCHPSFACK